MRKFVSILFLSVLVACGDEDPMSGHSPSTLQVQVLDVGGTPVVGAHVGISYRLSGSLPVPAGAATPPPAPFRTALAQNTPNPFELSTRIQFTKAEESATQLLLLDRDGDLVTTLFDDMVPAGVYESTIQGTAIPNGSFRVRLETSEGDSTVLLDIDTFHQYDDPARLEDVYLGTTDREGRFEVFLDTLPVGETVLLTTPASPDIYGEDEVLSSIRVDAWSDLGGSARIGSSEVDVGRLSKSVSVEVTLR